MNEKRSWERRMEGKKEGRKEGKRSCERRKEGKKSWERRMEGKRTWERKKERKKERRMCSLTPPLLAALNFLIPAHRYSTHRGYCSQPTTLLLRVLFSLPFFHCSSSFSSSSSSCCRAHRRSYCHCRSWWMLSTIWLPCDLADAECCVTVAASDAQVRLLIFFSFFSPLAKLFLFSCYL